MTKLILANTPRTLDGGGSFLPFPESKKLDDDQQTLAGHQFSFWPQDEEDKKHSKKAVRLVFANTQRGRGKGIWWDGKNGQEGQDPRQPMSSFQRASAATLRD